MTEIPPGRKTTGTEMEEHLNTEKASHSDLLIQKETGDLLCNYLHKGQVGHHSSNTAIHPTTTWLLLMRIFTGGEKPKRGFKQRTSE